jgi:glycerate kinase
MRILIAPDKFKGSLSAARVASIVATELRGVFPDWGVDLCPIADGGEGTAEALTTAQNGTWVQIPTRDAQNRPLVAQYGLTQENGRLQAVMEMSAASGLALVSDLPLSPSTASTYGTGLMMLDAIERGASRILIGIGGSATNDAGTGMAAALGFRFLDENGRDLENLPADLLRLKNILPPAKWPVDVLVACDVTNPLLGPEGCTRIYGPQKGIHDFEWFESRLQHLVIRRPA